MRLLSLSLLLLQTALTVGCADDDGVLLVFHEPFDELGPWSLLQENPVDPVDDTALGSASAAIENGKLTLSASQDGLCTRAQASTSDLSSNGGEHGQGHDSLAPAPANNKTWRFLFDITDQSSNAMSRSDVIVSWGEQTVSVAVSSFVVDEGPLRLEVDLGPSVVVRLNDVALEDGAPRVTITDGSEPILTLIAHGCSPDNGGSSHLEVESITIWELDDPAITVQDL